MGSPHFEIRIKYENISDAKNFYELLCALEKGESRNFDSKIYFISGIISKESFDKVVKEIYALFEFEDESPCFGNPPIILQDEIHFSVYGPLTETEHLVNIITNISIITGIESYHRIDYATSAEGINFYWIREYDLFHYYEDQRTFDIFMNWQTNFEESVQFIVEKYESGEIECSHCRIREAAKYVGDLASYNIYDYLISVGMFSSNKELKGLRNSSDRESNQQKRRLRHTQGKDGLRKGIENLFKKQEDNS